MRAQLQLVVTTTKMGFPSIDESYRFCLERTVMKTEHDSVSFSATLILVVCLDLLFLPRSF